MRIVKIPKTEVRIDLDIVGLYKMVDTSEHIGDKIYLVTSIFIKNKQGRIMEEIRFSQKEFTELELARVVDNTEKVLDFLDKKLKVY